MGGNNSFTYRIAILFPVLIFGSFLHCQAYQISNPDTSAADTTSKSFGYVQIDVDTDTCYVYLVPNYDDPIPLTGEKKLKLPAGSHRLLAFGRNIPDTSLRFYLDDGETRSISVAKNKKRNKDDRYTAYAAMKWNANLMVFSDDETLITVLHSDYSAFGTLRAKLPAGVHRVHFQHNSGKSKEFFVEVNNYQLKTVENYIKPFRSNSIIGGVIPGASQLYKGERIKSISFFTLIGLSAGLTIHYNQKLGTATEDFNSIQKVYHAASDEQEALELGDQLDLLGNEANALKKKRNIFRLSAILLYAANIFDAFRPPDGGFAKQKTLNPYMDFSFDLNSDYVEAQIQVNF